MRIWHGNCKNVICRGLVQLMEVWKLEEGGGGVWYMYLNNSFQFWNNITRISTYFYTHTYLYILFTSTRISKKYEQRY